MQIAVKIYAKAIERFKTQMIVFIYIFTLWNGVKIIAE
jgi:hypothetical protein